MGINVNTRILFAVTHIVIYNKSNISGLSICYIIFIPFNNKTTFLYNNRDDLALIHGNISIKYYKYILNNNVNRHSPLASCINNNIVNKYFKDRMKYIKNSRNDNNNICNNRFFGFLLIFLLLYFY